MYNLNIAFFGTSDFSVSVLDELLAHKQAPSVIIAAPDARQGRNMELTPPPAKQWAHEHGIDVLQPESIDRDFLDELQNSEWDLFLVASYGKILPKELIEIPAHGTVNIHPSLLPKLRGASPVKTAILEDARDAVGVSLMLVDEKMDHGPVIAQATVELDEWPTAGILEDLLAREGARLFLEALPQWTAGNIEPEVQNHEAATFTKKLLKTDCGVDVASTDAYATFRRIQACTPNPGAWFTTTQSGKEIRVKITEVDYTDGKLIINRVIPAGKKEMDYQDFLRGLQS